MVLAYKFFFVAVPDNQHLSTPWRAKSARPGLPGPLRLPPEGRWGLSFGGGRGKASQAVAQMFLRPILGRPRVGPGGGRLADAPVGVGARLLPGRPPGFLGPELC